MISIIIGVVVMIFAVWYTKQSGEILRRADSDYIKILEKHAPDDELAAMALTELAKQESNQSAKKINDPS